MADPFQDTPGAEEGGDMPASGYCIEINVAADGSITVGVEPAKDEAAEEMPAPGADPAAPPDPAAAAPDDDSAQPVKGIREAVQFVLDTYKNQGQVVGAMDGMDDLEEGFTGKRPPPPKPPMKPGMM